MIVKLQMKFNRTRQAQITNDLVDIITGANGQSFPPRNHPIRRSGPQLSRSRI